MHFGICWQNGMMRNECVMGLQAIDKYGQTTRNGYSFQPQLHLFFIIAAMLDPFSNEGGRIHFPQASQMDASIGSMMSSNSKLPALRSLSSSLVLIRTLWFQNNTRILRSQISFSTGAIIGRRCVLTAGHNLYQPALQAFCDQVQLIFNFKADREITKDALRISFPLEYNNYKCPLTRDPKDGKKTNAHDIALIRIPDNHPKLQSLLTNTRDGAYLMRDFQLEHKGGVKGYIQGFPDLTQDDVKQFKKKREAALGNKATFVQALIRQDAILITRIQDSSLYYSCRTKSGQSGSPIMVAMPREGRTEWLIIGVHNSFSKSKGIGKGVFLSSKIGTLLKEWYVQLTAHKLYVRLQRMQVQDGKSSQASFVSSLPDRPIPQTKDGSSQQQMAKNTKELHEYLQLQLQTLQVDLMGHYRGLFLDTIPFGHYVDSIRECFNQAKEKLIESLTKKINLERNYSIEPAGSLLINKDHQKQMGASQDYRQGQNKQEQHRKDKEVSRDKHQDFQYEQDRTDQEESNMLYDGLLRDHAPEIMAQIDIDPPAVDPLLHPSMRTSGFDTILRELSSSIDPSQLKQEDAPIIAHPKMESIGKRIERVTIGSQLEQGQCLCYECLYATQEWHVCLQEECARQSVELCPYCIDQHRGHTIVPARKETLSSLFHKFNQIFYENHEAVSRIEGRVAVMTNLLNMNLLKKMMESLAAKLKDSLQLLSAMLFKNDSQIQDRVAAILNHDRDELYSASLTHKLMHSFDSQKLGRFLQAQIDKARLVVTSDYQNIRSSLDYLRKKVQQEGEGLDYEESLVVLRQKYESIVNIKNEGSFLVQPANLYEIQQGYYEFIRNVVIIKDYEEYFEKEYTIQKRKGRQAFWKKAYLNRSTLKRLVINQLIPIERLQFLLQQYVLRLQDISSLIENSHKHEEGSSILAEHIDDLLNQKLMRKHSEFREQEQYHWQSPQLKIFSVLLHPKMTNLVRIQLRYEHARCCDFNSFFKLQAKDLFRIIDQNPNLQKLAIEGVRVYHFGRFMVKFWQIRCSIPQEAEDFHYMLKDEDISMMKRINPKRTLQLDIGLLLKLRNKKVIHSLDYFLRVFPSVSNLKVAIRYSESINKEDGLQKILKRSLERINRLKIWIMGQYLKANTLLLDAIKGLDNIVSVYISDVEVSLKETDHSLCEKGLISSSHSDTPKIEQQKPPFDREKSEISERFVEALAQILSHDDIEKFSIKRCPLIMQMQLRLLFLKELIMVFRDRRTVDWRALKTPQILQLLYLQNVELQFQNLQDFFRKLQGVRYFQMIDSNIYDSHLLKIPVQTYHRIKILNISLCKNITDAFANAIFPELRQITVLDISKTGIDAKSVLMINSVAMQKLIISGLDTVDDYLLREIDKKWPMLASLNIYDCKGAITDQGISDISFRNLSELQISHAVLEQTTKFGLLMRGVQILPFY